jgi:hypothetical protein
MSLLDVREKLTPRIGESPRARNRPSRQTNELFEVSEFGWVFGTVSATGSCGMPPETDAAHSSAAAPGVCAFVGAIA